MDERLYKLKNINSIPLNTECFITIKNKNDELIFYRYPILKTDFDYNKNQVFVIALSKIFKELNIVSGLYNIAIEGLSKVISNMKLMDASPDKLEIKVSATNKTIQELSLHPNQYRSNSLQFLDKTKSISQYVFYDITYSKEHYGRAYFKLLTPLNFDYVNTKKDNEIYVNMYKKAFVTIKDKIVWRTDEEKETKKKIISLPKSATYDYSFSIGKNFIQLTENISSSLLSESYEKYPTINYGSMLDTTYFQSSKNFVPIMKNNIGYLYQSQVQIKNIINSASVLGTSSEELARSSSYSDLLLLHYKDYNEYLDGLTYYEKYMINSLTSGSYPKDSSSYLLPIDDETTTSSTYTYTPVTWYSSQLLKATTRDRTNNSIILNNMPEFYFTQKFDPYGQFKQFIITLSEFWDELKIQTDQLYFSHRTDNYLGLYNVMSEDLQRTAKMMGFYLNNPYNYKSLYNWLVSAHSASDASYKIIVHQLWRRLLHDLNFIQQSKGTLNSIYYLMNSLGIPRSFIRVNELTLHDKESYNIMEPTYKINESYYLYNGGDKYINVQYMNNVFTTASTDDFCYEIQMKSNYQSHNADVYYYMFGNSVNDSESWQIVFDKDSTNELYGDVYLVTSGSFVGDYSIKLLNDIYFLNNKFTYFAFNFDKTNSSISSSAIRYEDGRSLLDTQSIVQNVSASVFNFLQSSIDLLILTGSEAIVDGHTASSPNCGIREFRFWNRILDTQSIDFHARQKSSMRIVDTQLDYLSFLNSNLIRYKFEKYDYGGTSSDYIEDKSLRVDFWKHATVPNDLSSTNWLIEREYIEFFYPQIGHEFWSDKIRTTYDTAMNTIDTKYVDMVFSPADLINEEIFDTLSGFNFNALLGDNYYVSSYLYLENYKYDYFTKWQTYFNFNDYLKFAYDFGPVFFSLVNQLTPYRVELNKGTLIKNHILYRNVYRRKIARLNVEPMYTQSINDIITITSEKFTLLNDIICPNPSIEGNKQQIYSIDKYELTVLPNFTQSQKEAYQIASYSVEQNINDITGFSSNTSNYINNTSFLINHESTYRNVITSQSTGTTDAIIRIDDNNSGVFVDLPNDRENNSNENQKESKGT